MKGKKGKSEPLNVTSLMDALEAHEERSRVFARQPQRIPKHFNLDAVKTYSKLRVCQASDRQTLSSRLLHLVQPPGPNIPFENSSAPEKTDLSSPLDPHYPPSEFDLGLVCYTQNLVDAFKAQRACMTR